MNRGRRPMPDFTENAEAIDVEAVQVSGKVTHIYTWLLRYEGGLTSLIGSYATEHEAQQRRPTRLDETTTMTLIRVRLP